MAFWTVIGTGIEGDLQGKTFGLSLNTDDQTYQAVGPDVDSFFSTKSGSYAVVVAPENGTKLVSASGQEVGFLTALNGTSSVGDTGTGRASEKGANFNWKLDSK